MVGKYKCKIGIDPRVRDHAHLFSMEDINKFKIFAKKNKNHLLSFESRKKIKQLSLNCHQFFIKRNLPFKINKDCKLFGITITNANYDCIFSKNSYIMDSTTFFK